MNLNATILGQAIAFILFVLFCMKYVWPPLIYAVEKRQHDIAENLMAVENAKKDLEIAKSEAANYLKQIQLQAKETLEQANQKQIKLINEAKYEAEIQCKKMFEQTNIQINIEKNKMYEELRTEIFMLALTSAKKIIAHSIDEKINDKIIDQIITEI